MKDNAMLLTVEGELKMEYVINDNKERYQDK